MLHKGISLSMYVSLILTSTLASKIIIKPQFIIKAGPYTVHIKTILRSNDMSKIRNNKESTINCGKKRLPG